MNNPLAKLYSWQVSSGQLDGWTSYHLAAGLFIAKVAQWCGSSDLWAVLWVLIIGVLWEIFEVWVEGTHETYGTKKTFNLFEKDDNSLNFEMDFSHTTADDVVSNKVLFALTGTF